MEKWTDGKLLTTEHFYHLGAKESNRNKMIEALVISESNLNLNEVHPEQEQISLFEI